MQSIAIFLYLPCVCASHLKQHLRKKERKDETMAPAINTTSAAPICSADTPLVPNLGDVPGLGGLFKGKHGRVGVQEGRDLKVSLTLSVLSAPSPLPHVHQSACLFLRRNHCSSSRRGWGESAWMNSVSAPLFLICTLILSGLQHGLEQSKAFLTFQSVQGADENDGVLCKWVRCV